MTAPPQKSLSSLLSRRLELQREWGKHKENPEKHAERLATLAGQLKEISVEIASAPPVWGKLPLDSTEKFELDAEYRAQCGDVVYVAVQIAAHELIFQTSNSEVRKVHHSTKGVCELVAKKDDQQKVSTLLMRKIPIN